MQTEKKKQIDIIIDKKHPVIVPDEKEKS